MSEEPSAEAEETAPSEEEGVVADDVPQEDPEITALKEEIANLEIDLKAKRSELNRNVDLAEEYSERGYQRKCAEMDNMRRMRAVSASFSHQISTLIFYKQSKCVKILFPNLLYDQIIFVNH